MIKTMNRNVEAISGMLKKKKYSEEDIASILDGIKADAPLRYIESAGFADTAESTTDKVKNFGEMDATKVDEEVIEIVVADNSTIEYPNDKGEQEAFAFDEQTLIKLGDKLEGVPVVIGKGHDADLPIAYFTKEVTVKNVQVDGKTRKTLIAKAKVRNDKDAPINKEFFKDPRWTMNGGVNKLSGSLRFSSTDVPYFFDDGTKVNYMTKPVPRHYAIVDSPFIEQSGIISKNFGENKGDINMVNTVINAPPGAGVPVAELKVETKVADPAPVAVTPVKEVEQKKEAPAPEVKVEVVPKTEFESAIAALKAQIGELMAKLTEKDAEMKTMKRNNLVQQIVVKKFGPNADKATTDKFEEEIKNFGEAELSGYLAGLGATIAAAPVKNFGKGTVDASPAVPAGKKLDLFYMKQKKN